MCHFSGATYVLFPITKQILIIAVIAALNWCPRCDKPICRHQKQISTLFGSKVEAPYVAVAAILHFVL